MVGTCRHGSEGPSVSAMMFWACLLTKEKSAFVFCLHSSDTVVEDIISIRLQWSFYGKHGDMWVGAGPVQSICVAVDVALRIPQTVFNSIMAGRWFTQGSHHWLGRWPFYLPLGTRRIRVRSVIPLNVQDAHSAQKLSLYHLFSIFTIFQRHIILQSSGSWWFLTKKLQGRTLGQGILSLILVQNMIRRNLWSSLHGYGNEVFSYGVLTVNGLDAGAGYRDS